MPVIFDTVSAMILGRDLADLFLLGLLRAPAVLRLFLLLLELVRLVAHLRGLLEVLRENASSFERSSLLDLLRQLAHVGRRLHRLDAHARARPRRSRRSPCPGRKRLLM
jgi:hypothetical protein